MTNQALHPLGRMPEFDERSRAFTVKNVIPLGAEPRTWFWDCFVRLNQGTEGACVGFGWAAELAASPVVIPNVTNQVGFDIYHAAQKIDEWPGENYEGTSVLAGAKIALANGWVPEYRWAFNHDDLVLAVAHMGPAIIGINWYTGMDQIGADGIAHVFGTVRGGHCVCIIGVDIGQKLFLIQNSWGQSWGQDGRCWITFDDMKRLLSERGDACIPMKRVGPADPEPDPPIPPEPEPPTPPEPEPVNMNIIDIRNQISGPGGFGAMQARPAILVHHTAGATLSVNATEAEELAHILAIDLQHKNQGFGGFAYHMIVFPSGRSWWAARFDRYRAHIAERNPEFIGCVLAGTFTTTLPGPAQLAGLKRSLLFIQANSDAGPGIFGHKQKAIPSDPTACPGIIADTNWEEFLEEDELTIEEKRQLQDRDGRVILDWLTTMEVNVRYDPSVFPASLVFYKPSDGRIMGSVAVESLPPWMTPALAAIAGAGLPLESLGR